MAPEANRRTVLGLNQATRIQHATNRQMLWQQRYALNCLRAASQSQSKRGELELPDTGSTQAGLCTGRARVHHR